MARITEATDAVRVLKGKLKEFNINPDHITVDAVVRSGGKWVVVFYYFFTRYVVELDEEGRVLSLRSGLAAEGSGRGRAHEPAPV